MHQWGLEGWVGVWEAAERAGQTERGKAWCRGTAEQFRVARAWKRERLARKGEGCGQALGQPSLASGPCSVSLRQILKWGSGMATASVLFLFRFRPWPHGQEQQVFCPSYPGQSHNPVHHHVDSFRLCLDQVENSVLLAVRREDSLFSQEGSGSRVSRC